VKQHLSRLYAKFDVGAHGERRRVQLANAAVTGSRRRCARRSPARRSRARRRRGHRPR
jgi:hypothetical protein